MKTWEQDFKHRARKVVRSRKAEDVRFLKELIKDMYEAEFGVAEIGRLLERDHTTIVHHLALMGFRPKEEAREKAKDWREYMESVRARRTSERALRTVRRSQKQEKSAEYREVREKVVELKKRAREMWAQGASHKEIASALGVKIPSVQYYLFYDSEGAPDRRKVLFKVQQKKLDGTVIETFRSVRAASMATGVPQSWIHRALRDGRYLSTGGFVWSALNANDYDLTRKENPRPRGDGPDTAEALGDG